MSTFSCGAPRVWNTFVADVLCLHVWCSRHMFLGRSHYEVGGSGTIYTEGVTGVEGDSIRRLIISNNHVGYPHEAVYSGGARRSILGGVYDDISEVGGVTWLYHPSQQYQFDVVTISGDAHVAIHSNMAVEQADVRIGYLMGDRSGVIHAGANQTFGYSDVNVYLPVNVMAYRY